jgi:hypothetical protein
VLRRSSWCHQHTTERREIRIVKLNLAKGCIKPSCSFSNPFKTIDRAWQTVIECKLISAQHASSRKDHTVLSLPYNVSPLIIVLQSWVCIESRCGHLQAEEPEEDMDVRGGGTAADERRIVKEGYESDDEEAKPFVNERVAGEIPSTIPSAVRPPAMHHNVEIKHVHRAVAIRSCSIWLECWRVYRLLCKEGSPIS